MAGSQVNQVRKPGQARKRAAISATTLYPENPAAFIIQEKIMKVKIDESCTACGLCVETCPEVFKMGDIVAEVAVEKAPPQFEDAVQQAADECPVEAIAVE